MDINIRTKYNIGDIVIGCYVGQLYKFKIEEIEVNYNSSYIDNDIRYKCVAVLENSEVTFYHEFEERELWTIDDLQKMIDRIKK